MPSDIFDVFLDNLHLSDINPRICGMQKCAPSHEYGPAVRDCHLLHYVLRGSGIFRRGDTTHTVHAGEIFVIRPDEITLYRADAADPWEYIWVGFDCSDTFAALLQNDVIPCPGAQAIFQRIIGFRDEPMNTWLVCAQLYELFAKLAVTQGQTGENTQRYVSQAINYIESNYPLTLRVESIAAGLGLSRNYFCRLFKSATGFSPQEYIVSFRLSKAAQFLTEYGMSPGEAARQVGYPDIYSFSRMFSRKYGMPPGRYAAGMQAKNE